MITLPWTQGARVIRPARVMTITHTDGTVKRLAEAQASITVGSETWVPFAGFALSAIQTSANGQPSSCTITVAATPGGSVFNSYEIADFKYDDAVVEIYLVDRANPTTKALRFKGNIGQITIPTSGAISMEVRGQSIKAQNPYSQVFGAMCRTDFGSTLCKVPLLPADVARNETVATGTFRRVRFASAGTPDDYLNVYLEATTGGTTGASDPTWSSTVGDTITDGTVVWTVRNAWTRYAKVASITNQFTITLDRLPDPRAVDGWYNGGVFVMRSGYSTGRGFEVGGWTSATEKTVLFLPLGAANNGALIAVGDWLEIFPGCDKTIATCASKYANSPNFRGEPYFLGVSQANQTVTG